MSRGRLSLEEVFTAEQAATVARFAELVEIYVAQHDVTLLIARKAVCLVRALQKNGYLPNKLPGKVYSSRAASFARLLSLSDSIALIDEVGITLRTVERVNEQLRRAQLTPDILLGALSSDEASAKKALELKARAISYMSRKETLEFSKAISRYVQLSGLSSNSDQPIIAIHTGEVSPSRLAQNMLTTDITTGGQLERGFRCLTVTYDARPWLNRLNVQSAQSLVKARMHIDLCEHVFTIIPFVIPGGMTKPEVNAFFSSIASEELIRGVDDDNPEAQLRLIMYALSRDLGNHLASTLLRKYNVFENFHVIKEQICLSDEMSSQLRESQPQEHELTKLDAADSVQLEMAIGSIRTDVLLEEEHHGANNLDAAEISLKSGNPVDDGDCVRQVASTALDLLVDEGLMVPCPTLERSGQYVRCYRGGEVSRLTRNHLGALGRKLEHLGIDAAEIVQNASAVNRIGVLYERFLSQGSHDYGKDISASEPLTFSYLGESSTIYGHDDAQFSLAKALERVMVTLGEDEWAYDEMAECFTRALQKIGSFYKQDSNPFESGSQEERLELLDRLVESDQRVGFAKARVALSAVYHWVLAEGDSSTEELKTCLDAAALRLSDADLQGETLDRAWIEKQNFSGDAIFAKDYCRWIVAPVRASEDYVAKAKMSVIEYLRTATDQQSRAEHRGELLVNELDTLYRELCCGREPIVERHPIMTVERLRGTSEYKVYAKLYSASQVALSQTAVFSERVPGAIVCFPVPNARPTYISSDLDASRPSVRGRASDINLVFPASCRKSIGQLLEQEGSTSSSSKMYLVCPSELPATKVEGIRNEIETVLNKKRQERGIKSFRYVDQRAMQFFGLGLPNHEAIVITYAIEVV